LRNRCGVPQKNLSACDINNAVLDMARKSGLITKGWSFDEAGIMLADCDLVFLCILPAAMHNFLEKWETAFKPGALITDIAGVKKSIAAHAEKIREDIDFIPGHPMAGFEKGGFINASFVNFTGKNYILCPLARNKPENLQFIKELILRMDFGRITETSAACHDEKIAYTSQLCHVIAASLIECESDTSIARFGGGSFEDFTRIAMLNAPMWAELFVSNRDVLLEKINRFEKSVDVIKNLVLEGNISDLEQILVRVRDRRLNMSDYCKTESGG